MELAKELALYLESTPELHGQKLVLVRSFCKTPVSAAIAEEKFYDWAVEGMEHMANEFDLDPEEIEMSVCREVARTYASEELKRIKAGAYKELDIMMREALESALRPGTKVQVRLDGKENSGKFGTIMEDSLEELLPSDFPLTNENEVKVRMEHNNKIDKVPVNRLDVVEAAMIFVPGADLLGV